jgi:23S rRNA A1618 N6-methylase RlmF
MNIIKEANPEAIEYLEVHHHRLWYRCAFGEASKVDYLINNISVSFNKQIKDFKGLNICNLVDRIRELITEKLCFRRQISKQLKSRILSHVINRLNALSKTIAQNKILWTNEHGVNWIHAIMTSTNWRNAITKSELGEMPL